MLMQMQLFLFKCLILIVTTEIFDREDTPGKLRTATFKRNRANQYLWYLKIYSKYSLPLLLTK